VDAIRAGKTVELTIDGCDHGADFAAGTPCARRRASLKALFAEVGIHDTQQLLAGLR
jgi:hypothetical protein